MRIGIAKPVITIITVITIILTSAAVLATTASPSASPSNADKKLQELETQIASKAAAMKNDVSKRIQNKSFIGQLKEIKDDKTPQIKSFILETKNGSKSVLVNEYTNYQDGINKKSSLTLKNIAKDDFLVALGDVDDKGTLIAKKIIKTKKIDFKAKFAVWGQVQSVFPTSITLIKADNQKFNLSLDVSTTYRLGNDEASLSDVKPNNFIIALGNKPSSDGKTADNSSSVNFAYLLNPNGNLKITKVATSSATPSASPKR